MGKTGDIFGPQPLLLMYLPMPVPNGGRGFCCGNLLFAHWAHDVPRLWLAIPAITMVLLRVLKYVTRYVCEVTRYVIHVTRNLNYVARFLS